MSPKKTTKKDKKDEYKKNALQTAQPTGIEANMPAQPQLDPQAQKKLDELKKKIDAVISHLPADTASSEKNNEQAEKKEKPQHSCPKILNILKMYVLSAKYYL